MPGAYPGKELELFALANNWKAYWSSRIRPLLGSDVLEVGAGIGSNTGMLNGGKTGRWVCLEPDAALAQRIPDFSDGQLSARQVEVVTGTLDDLPEGEIFDTVLYIDVLEHIEDDAAELARAVKRIRPGGTLIVLAPAHPVLFSEFDHAVGHFRRYTRRMLEELRPPGTIDGRFSYLDAAGVLASLGNRLLLRKSVPSAAQIRMWDRYLVPVSRVLDPLLGHRFGKSALAIWQLGQGNESDHVLEGQVFATK